MSTVSTLATNNFVRLHDMTLFLVIDSGMDISLLTNLTSIRFMGRDCEWGTEDGIVDVIHLLLYQLNAPRLREISITVCLEEANYLDAIATVDRVLADAKFNMLKFVRIEPSVGESSISWRQFVRKVKAKFPLIAKRGILKVVYLHLGVHYLDDSLGMT